MHTFKPCIRFTVPPKSRPTYAILPPSVIPPSTQTFMTKPDNLISTPTNISKPDNPIYAPTTKTDS